MLWFLFETRFDIGAIENANLYSSHAKISNTKGPILDLLLKLNRGVNPSGQIKLNFKDVVNVNGQFKVTDKDGKGNGVIIVDFIKVPKWLLYLFPYLSTSISISKKISTKIYCT